MLGARLVPLGSDPRCRGIGLATLDAVYFTGGDARGAARRAARGCWWRRRARWTCLLRPACELDVLVSSANDAGEAYRAGSFEPAPRYVVRTHGAEGGAWTGSDAATGTWKAAPVPAPPVDAYGCGDSFAAGLTYGMGAGLGIAGALELASRCGAACLTGRGPYAGQLEGRGARKPE